MSTILLEKSVIYVQTIKNNISYNILNELYEIQIS
jgi:hypothetical protein